MREFLQFAHPPLDLAGARRSMCYPDSLLLAIVDCQALFRQQLECLAGAATLTQLLRQAGRPAELVIGVAHVPFEAHAWCELDGSVIEGTVLISSSIFGFALKLLVERNTFDVSID